VVIESNTPKSRYTFAQYLVKEGPSVARRTYGTDGSPVRPLIYRDGSGVISSHWATPSPLRSIQRLSTSPSPSASDVPISHSPSLLRSMRKVSDLPSPLRSHSRTRVPPGPGRSRSTGVRPRTSPNSRRTRSTIAGSYIGDVAVSG